jgi:hypothetical protein
MSAEPAQRTPLPGVVSSVCWPLTAERGLFGVVSRSAKTTPEKAEMVIFRLPVVQAMLGNYGSLLPWLLELRSWSKVQRGLIVVKGRARVSSVNAWCPAGI